MLISVEESKLHIIKPIILFDSEQILSTCEVKEPLESSIIPKSLILSHLFRLCLLIKSGKTVGVNFEVKDITHLERLR